MFEQEGNYGKEIVPYKDWGRVPILLRSYTFSTQGASYLPKEGSPVPRFAHLVSNPAIFPTAFSPLLAWQDEKKLSITLNCVLKRANELNRQFEIDSFCFRPSSEIWSRSSWMEIVPEPVRNRIVI